MEQSLELFLRRLHTVWSVITKEPVCDAAPSHFWQRLECTLFPPAHDSFRPLTLRDYLIFALPSVALCAVVGMWLSPEGLMGYDWRHYFSMGQRIYGTAYYPPWIVLVAYLGWPPLIGLTLASLALALYQRRSTPIAAMSACLTLPVFWVLFLGQVDGVALFGLTGLPWLIPLATIKPQVSYLACLANKRYLFALIVWLGISMAVWGLWPLDILGIAEFSAWQQPHDIHLWPWSLPVVLVMLWLSRGDADMLMLAGTFAMPYLHSYHYFLVVPALARIGHKTAILALLVSWLPLLANWYGSWCWYLGHLFPLLLWGSLFVRRWCHVGSWQAVLGIRPYVPKVLVK
jgi:hypothetical protein